MWKMATKLKRNPSGELDAFYLNRSRVPKATDTGEICTMPEKSLDREGDGEGWPRGPRILTPIRPRAVSEAQTRQPPSGLPAEPAKPAAPACGRSAF